MSDYATIHGFEFNVEVQGFGHHERERDLCIRRLWSAMGRMKSANVAKLHAELLREEDEYPKQASRLCHSAIAMQCRRWHRPDELWLTLHAVPAPAPEEMAEQDRRRSARGSLQLEFEAHMRQRPAGHPRADWQGRFWQAHGL